ncbi:hypothetical protein [Brenneria tiliae]|uniref:Uncharacterized protein n=1 Tax=Brenneria tiliae TaxID=2914984 RepID=A0ABT0MRA1_9GAMM|nr:hypothetical protein [Brenneria tiliae]MCL2892087.1 hypothetical protein [Brenneria tiliae]
MLLEIGVKAGITGVVAKEIADNLSSEELEHLVTLQMMGNDEITGKYLGALQDKYAPDASSNPNLGKDLNNEQKVELGGTGSGTPGGWEPQDEENASNKDSNQIGKWSIDELSDGAKHIDPASKKGDLTLALPATSR